MRARVQITQSDEAVARYVGAAASTRPGRWCTLGDDAEAFASCWNALRGDPDDANQTLRVTRLKNKLGKGQEPFNFHLNALFQPSALADPLMIEIQIWITPIMDLNDVSHSQYEVSRAKSVEAI